MYRLCAAPTTAMKTAAFHIQRLNLGRAISGTAVDPGEDSQNEPGKKVGVGMEGGMRFEVSRAKKNEAWRTVEFGLAKK